MKELSLQDRMRYQFDHLMSKGSIALIGWLLLLLVLLIVTVSLVVMGTGIDPENRDFLQITWAALMRSLDPGTMGDDSGSWAFLFAMLTITAGGILTFSTLIGLLTTGITNTLEQLRKGRSIVAESGHTVILGWSPQVFTIVSEVVIANENQPYGCIAILAPKDKVEMEEEIHKKVGKTGRTRIVCRTGNPLDLIDLEIVNPHSARSIIIVAPENDEPDTHVLKSILALTNNPNRRPEPYHIVAVIRDRQNLAITQMVGRHEVELVHATQVIAQITAQTCRKAGLSVAITELLDFDGDEIYFQEEPKLVGKAFGDALLAYEDSALIGLFRNGRVQLKPPLSTMIEEGDQLIAVSEDDDTVRVSDLDHVEIDVSAIVETPPSKPAPERTLILGWNQMAAAIIQELDHYVPPGSEVTIVTSEQNSTLIKELQCSNQTLSLQVGNTTDRDLLEGLKAHTYDHIIVLSTNDVDAQQADARTLMTLLHLRDMANQHDHSFSIVSQMVEPRNQELAEMTGADDFIISDKLISLMLSQISENKALAAVLDDLFDADGAELYFKPASDYIQLGKPVNFYTVVEAARRRDEIAVGYRLQALALDKSKGYGVWMNPKKSQQVTFAQKDSIIVLAEEQGST